MPYDKRMNPEAEHTHESAVESDLAALRDAVARLREKFPAGLELGISQYREWLRNELTYSSNAIEGNTLSSIETKMVIEDGLVIPDKSLREHLEARDHALAWDYATEVLEKNSVISATDILALHSRVLYSTNNAEAGYLRRGGVRVAGSHTVFPNALKVPDLVDRLVADLNGRPDGLDPVIHAAHMHLDLVKIHPFVDGNGRTARLLMNVLLRRAGLPALPIYPRDRAEYLRSIDAADQDEGASFVSLITRLELATLEQLLKSDVDE